MKDKHVCRAKSSQTETVTSRRSVVNEARRFYCRSCDDVCDNRRMLCVHQNCKHGGDLQPSLERGEAPWDAGDHRLRDMYEDNRCVILADARIDRGRKVVYNLPTVNIRTGLHEINDKLQEIFDDLQGAFKVAIPQIFFTGRWIVARLCSEKHCLGVHAQKPSQ